MAYSVNWLTKVISIPSADLTLVSGTRYQLTMSDFLSEIRRLEWSFSDGLWAEQILEHTNAKTLAGATYAPFDEIINGYTIQFTGAATRVDLIGSNNNLIDVLIPTGVAVVPSNSAGLQTVVSGSGVTSQDKVDIANEVRTELTAELAAILDAHKLLRNKRVLDPTTGVETIYDDNGAVLYTRNVYENSTGTQPYRGQGAERVERYT